jgi:hypothetical protein
VAQTGSLGEAARAGTSRGRAGGAQAVELMAVARPTQGFSSCWFRLFARVILLTDAPTRQMLARVTGLLEDHVSATRELVASPLEKREPPDDKRKCNRCKY